MTAGRLIATANVSASPADSEVNPLAARFQAFLAAARARFNLPDGAQMRAAFSQDPDPWSFLGRRRFFDHRRVRPARREVLHNGIGKPASAPVPLFLSLEDG